MALKICRLRYSLWKTCDEVRGTMDASQYEDDILIGLLMKHVSGTGMPTHNEI